MSSAMLSSCGVQRSRASGCWRSAITREALAWRSRRSRDSHGWPKARYSGRPSNGRKPTSSNQLRAAAGALRTGIQASATMRMPQSRASSQVAGCSRKSMRRFHHARAAGASRATKSPPCGGPCGLPWPWHLLRCGYVVALHGATATPADRPAQPCLAGRLPERRGRAAQGAPWLIPSRTAPGGACARSPRGRTAPPSPRRCPCTRPATRRSRRRPCGTRRGRWPRDAGPG